MGRAGATTVRGRTNPNQERAGRPQHSDPLSGRGGSASKTHVQAILGGRSIRAVPRELARRCEQRQVHPASQRFGAHSYSAWKGQEGLPDRTGDKNQALYFQKHTATETFAAGVAVMLLDSFEGDDDEEEVPEEDS